MVHVPTATSVTVDPETVQTDGVELANETTRPLDADALNDTGPRSTRVSAGCANVIVCVVGDADVTEKDCVTGVAAE